MPYKKFLSDLDEKAKNIMYGEVEFILKDEIPRDSSKIYSEVQKWIQVEKICVVFVDMVDSSRIDYESYRPTSAKIYETFTGSLVRTMERFDAAYIDIQGDGVLAIFDGTNSWAKGFIAATTFRTYVRNYLVRRVNTLTQGRVSNLEASAGLSYGDIIVKKVGTRLEKKEVWAYKRVNEAAKLAGIANDGSIAVSKRAYQKLSQIDWIENSCGCRNGEDVGERVRLWKEVEEDRLKPPVVSEAFELSSIWCDKHGEEYMDNIIQSCNLESIRVKAMEMEDYENEFFTE